MSAVACHDGHSHQCIGDHPGGRRLGHSHGTLCVCASTRRGRTAGHCPFPADESHAENVERRSHCPRSAVASRREILGRESVTEFSTDAVEIWVPKRATWETTMG